MDGNQRVGAHKRNGRAVPSYTRNQPATSMSKDRRSVEGPSRSALEQFAGGIVRGDGPLGDVFTETEYAHADLKGREFFFDEISDVQFTECNLDGARFEGRPRMNAAGAMRLARVSYRGSSLRFAQFGVCEYMGVDFRDTDVTGVRFAYPLIEGAVLFGGSNLTGDQLDDLIDFTATKKRQYIKYDTLTPDALMAAVGWDEGDLLAHMWSGDVEIRDNITLEIVQSGRFDAEKHHIPTWATAPFAIM